MSSGGPNVQTRKSPRAFSKGVYKALNELKECKGKGMYKTCQGVTRTVNGWCRKCKAQYRYQKTHGKTIRNQTFT